jgi:hypothetical protein
MDETLEWLKKFAERISEKFGRERITNSSVR